jgi:UDP-sulfoquinovose synthase
MGLNVEVDHLQDPRVEAEEHYYNAKHSKLIDLGLKPHLLSDSLLDSLMNIAIKYRDRADASLMLPQVNWREPRNDRRLQMSKTARNSLGASRVQAASEQVVEKAKKYSRR